MLISFFLSTLLQAFSFAEETKEHLFPLESLSKGLEETQQKVITLEQQVQFIHEKIEALRLELEVRLPSSTEPKMARISPSKVNRQLSSIATKSIIKDLTQESIWEEYQKGVLMIHAQNYTDAILHLATFLSTAEDHFLAGHAQFYIAEAYFNQKIYDQAITEYQKVLNLYDKSPMVASSLWRIYQSQTHLSKTAEAQNTKDLLLKAFACSPEAQKFSLEEKSAPQKKSPEPASSSQFPNHFFELESTDPFPESSKH